MAKRTSVRLSMVPSRVHSRDLERGSALEDQPKHSLANFAKPQKNNLRIICMVALLILILAALAGVYMVMHDDSTSEFERLVRAGAPEARIAQFAKRALTGKTAREMRDMTASYYVTMKLLNKDGKWADPLLEEIREDLLPTTLSVSDFEMLFEDMMVNASRNPNVHEFLTELEKRIRVPGAEKEWFDTVLEESPKNIPEFVAYSMYLERLTRAMRRNHKLAIAVGRVWKVKRPSGYQITRDCFILGVKLYSVETPFVQAIESLAKGEIDPDFLNHLLPVNILEAAIYDRYKGFPENASAGKLVSKHKPGSDAHGGPARITSDGNGIELGMPLAQSWADNYQGWNLALVSQMGCLYIFAKLLIPVVSGYQDSEAVKSRVDNGETVPSNAKQYIYTRALALYAHLHFELFLGYFRESFIEENDPRINSPWKSEEVTRLFGQINAKHAENYDREVEQLGQSASLYCRVWGCITFLCCPCL